MGDAGTAPVRPTQQVPVTMPPGGAFPAGGIPFIPQGVPMSGPPPPFNEMLDLLRVSIS